MLKILSVDQNQQFVLWFLTENGLPQSKGFYNIFCAVTAATEL